MTSFMTTSPWKDNFAMGAEDVSAAAVGEPRRFEVQNMMRGNDIQLEPKVDAFSFLPETSLSASSLPDHSSSLNSSAQNRNFKQFPEIVFEMLTCASDEKSESIVSWHSDGKSFRVHQRKEFVDAVMPRFFRQTKYSSFQRQLKLYGFQRITREQEKGHYYHELFQRDMPQACTRILRASHNKQSTMAVSDGGAGMLPMQPGGPAPDQQDTFPLTLHKMLKACEDVGAASVVSWQPHGKAFRVHDPQMFAELIMPCFFHQTRYSSFQRQLNLYGFQRFTQGRDHNGYFHENFVRDQPELCRTLKRTRIKGTEVRQKPDPRKEPDYYKSMDPEALREHEATLAAMCCDKGVSDELAATLKERLFAYSSLEANVFPFDGTVRQRGEEDPESPGFFLVHEVKMAKC